MTRRGRRRRKLLDDLKDRRGYSHLKEEALDRTMWRNRLGGGFGPVVRQNTEWMNECSGCQLTPEVPQAIVENGNDIKIMLLPHHCITYDGCIALPVLLEPRLYFFYLLMVYLLT